MTVEIREIGNKRGGKDRFKVYLHQGHQAFLIGYPDQVNLASAKWMAEMVAHAIQENNKEVLSVPPTLPEVPDVSTVEL